MNVRDICKVMTLCVAASALGAAPAWTIKNDHKTKQKTEKNKVKNGNKERNYTVGNERLFRLISEQNRYASKFPCCIVFNGSLIPLDVPNQVAWHGKFPKVMSKMPGILEESSVSPRYQITIGDKRTEETATMGEVIQALTDLQDLANRLNELGGQHDYFIQNVDKALSQLKTEP